MLVPDVPRPTRPASTRHHGIAHVARPVHHAADQEPAEDVVEATGREPFVGPGQLFHVALDVRDIRRRGRPGPVDVRDGGEVEAVGVEGGRVGGGEMVRDGAGSAADVEEAVRVAELGVDHAVVHEVCEAGGLVFEAVMLDGAGGSLVVA